MFLGVDMNIMLDLETLDTKPTAVVTSIGIAVDLGDGAMETHNFCLHHEDWQLQMAEGKRTTSASTLVWWLRQSEEARQSLANGNIYLGKALRELSAIVTRYPGATWWANGAAFDFPIIRSLYEFFNGPYADRDLWSFRDERCYRTLRSLFPHIKAPEFKGAAHRAIDDAVFQLEHLKLILQDPGLPS